MSTVTAMGIGYKGLGANGFADAPVDGKSYVRLDAGWVEAAAGFDPSADNIIHGNWHFVNETTTSVSFAIDPDFTIPPEA